MRRRCRYCGVMIFAPSQFDSRHETACRRARERGEAARAEARKREQLEAHCAELVEAAIERGRELERAAALTEAFALASALIGGIELLASVLPEPPSREAMQAFVAGARAVLDEARAAGRFPSREPAESSAGEAETPGGSEKAKGGEERT